ncbi:hypothetical protein [Paenibacillus sp. MMS20-IR301]|uniref:hypothetical protein n=1 Tax=Paenibacillus sp. MMS20-IR301 TaxID=2895946 RepID=UPI0028E3F4CF|nr:hypothetical protein [Paenibacillus sp. MMS20-IR301]WNS41392.1 hypothetical protein LOS79_20415 [Paenibacillus sp. MMS20-IR301]
MAKTDWKRKDEDRQGDQDLNRPRIWKKLTLGRIFLLIFLLGLVVYHVGTLVQMFTSFEARVSSRINLNEITSIEIIRSYPDKADEVTVTVTDPADIAGIMDAFEGVRLRSSYASHEFNRNYWMKIDVNDRFRFMIWVDDQKYISISDADRRDKYSSGSFKIINHYDIGPIDRLFP